METVVIFFAVVGALAGLWFLYRTAKDGGSAVLTKLKARAARLAAAEEAKLSAAVAGVLPDAVASFEARLKAVEAKLALTTLASTAAAPIAAQPATPPAQQV